MKKMMEKPHQISSAISFTEVKTQVERGSSLRHRASRRQQLQARGVHELDFQGQPMISAYVLMLYAEPLLPTVPLPSELEEVCFANTHKSPASLSTGLSG